MEIWSKVCAFGRKVADVAANAVKIGKTQALALTVAGMMALPSVAAFAEDAGGAASGGKTAQQFASAQSTAETELQVGDLAKCAYEVATKNISTTVVYIVLLAAVGLAIAWVLKIFRFGKRG